MTEAICCLWDFGESPVGGESFVSSTAGSDFAFCAWSRGFEIAALSLRAVRHDLQIHDVSSRGSSGVDFIIVDCPMCHAVCTRFFWAGAQTKFPRGRAGLHMGGGLPHILHRLVPRLLVHCTVFGCWHAEARGDRALAAALRKNPATHAPRHRTVLYR